MATLAVGTLAIGTGCSSSPGTPEGTAATAAFTGRSPAEITPPPAEGKDLVLPQPAAPLPTGYVQEEYFVGGIATRFDPVETPNDGFWTVSPAEDAKYRTRIIVRRPENAEDFSGTVVLEWFNVSAIEAAPDWGYNSEEIGREGHAYIGVSAQSQRRRGWRDDPRCRGRPRRCDQRRTIDRYQWPQEHRPGAVWHVGASRRCVLL